MQPDLWLDSADAMWFPKTKIWIQGEDRNAPSRRCDRSKENPDSYFSFTDTMFYY